MTRAFELSDLPFTVTDLHRAYHGGVPPQAVMAETFHRIRAVDDAGIFLHLIDEEQAVAAAEHLRGFEPGRRPLWGIPVAVKDNIDVAGMPTTAACPAFAYRAEADAFVVKRLRDAGALVIGKTNLDQFATGLTGMRTPYPVPRNALDSRLVPGGSSSGSAVAVAHGLVSLALGTDTAGSGRVPAGMNNVVGLKPSLGSLSASGVVPACRTAETVSILALTTEDAWAAFEVMAAFDPDDAWSKPAARAIRQSPRSAFTVGVPTPGTRHFFGDEEQATAYERALEGLAALGGEIVELDFGPFYDVGQLLYGGPWIAERYAAVEALLDREPSALHPVTRQVIASACGLSAVDAFRGIYRLAELRRALEPQLAALDLLCVPTVPTLYTRADLEHDPLEPNARLGTYTSFVNLMDLCGIAVPTAPRNDGGPGGVTLLASAGADGLLAAVGGALHRRANVPLGATTWPVGTAYQAPVNGGSARVDSAASRGPLAFG